LLLLFVVCVVYPRQQVNGSVPAQQLWNPWLTSFDTAHASFFLIRQDDSIAVLHGSAYTVVRATQQVGSGTFRSSPVFLLLGAKVSTGNIRSLERKFPGTFAPVSESSRELSFQGVNVPRNIRSAERYTGERTVRVTTNVHNAITKDGVLQFRVGTAVSN